MVKVKEDMTGWVMSEHGVSDSRLTVIKQDEDYISPNSERKAQWLCECSCEEHNKIVVLGTLLKRGVIRSCGCLHREQAAINGKNNHKTNVYDLTHEYGIGYTSKNEQFLFDIEDYELIKDYCWHYNIWVIWCLSI